METARPEEWYRLEDKGDNVTYIFEQFIPPFYRCNMWYVRGRDKDMLIDSGMGVVSLKKEVPLVAERPVVAVASHTHFDHIGCHHEFEERLVHAHEAEILAQPSRANTLIDVYVQDEAEIFTKLPPGGFDPTTYMVRPAPATRIVEDGAIIDLGDRQFEVIHTPGHSPGGIALWEEVRRILFSGDIVYDGPLVEETYHADLDDYIASMERLLQLPARIVHGGHFDSFDGNRLRQIIQNWLIEKKI